jgi:hypothetical protein
MLYAFVCITNNSEYTYILNDNIRMMMFVFLLKHLLMFSSFRCYSNLIFRLITMTDEQELLDYDETDDAPQQTGTKNGTSNGSSGLTSTQNGSSTGTQSGAIRGSYVSIHASGFKDFLLKPELLRAIMDCGFEHPSEGFYKSITKLK